MKSEKPSRDNHLLPVEIDCLSLRLNGQAIIRNISLKVEKPGITIIIGPNGAGKTILLSLLHGLIKPEKGQITWNGRGSDASIRKRQSMVFQSPVLLNRSVADNIDFVLKHYQIADRQKTRDRLLARVGLMSRAGQNALALSAGEKQKLALVRALASKPDILFLDEPTANLDPASLLDIEKMVKNVAQDGIKVFFISHDIGQARRMADDVIFMHHGRAGEHAPAAKFFKNPENPLARQFINGDIIL